jgi:hypothetical protein
MDIGPVDSDAVWQAVRELALDHHATERQADGVADHILKQLQLLSEPKGSNVTTHTFDIAIDPGRIHVGVWRQWGKAMIGPITADD